MRSGTTKPKIQTCPTCGRMRVYHPSGVYGCPVPPEVTKALRSYAAANGPRWKRKLLLEWEAGTDSAELRQARNMIGPTNLYKIKVTS